MQQLDGSVAALNILSLFLGARKGDTGLSKKINTSFATRADGCERDGKWP